MKTVYIIYSQNLIERDYLKYPSVNWSIISKWIDNKDFGM
jgi:hypothetical protein